MKNKINDAFISFAFQKARVICDRKCNKAWGINNRPKIQLSDEDEDDYCFLADNELGEAPKDPGTYEGGVGKPSNPDEFPQKWCIQECERSVMSNPYEWMLDLELDDYSKRVYNKQIKPT